MDKRAASPAPETTAAATPSAPASSDIRDALPEEDGLIEDGLIEDDLLVEDVSIDGMCGVY